MLGEGKNAFICLAPQSSNRGLYSELKKSKQTETVMVTSH